MSGMVAETYAILWATVHHQLKLPLGYPIPALKQKKKSNFTYTSYYAIPTNHT